MREDILPARTLALMHRLAAHSAPALRGWTLAGGTGLALHLGHRDSDDLDLFHNDNVRIPALLAVLRAVGACETLQEDADTLTVQLEGTKLSFFRVGDPFLFPATPFCGFPVADPRDIALMKLAAVSGRGSRKDFVDLRTLLCSPPSLQDYFELLPKKYGGGRVDGYHILKSLVYFEDAEREPMPRMRIPFSWEECRRYFEREAQRIVLDG